MSHRLYHIRCHGMQTTIGGQVAFGQAYVVAPDPTEAYRKLRATLDARDIGFAKDREMLSIELVAEAVEYPDCGIILYL